MIQILRLASVQNKDGEAAMIITDAQRRMIFKLKTENGISKDTLYEIIYQVSRKEHISELSKLQAISVIDRLTGKTDSQDGRATKKQIFFIERLADEIGWTDRNRLYGFIKKRFKIDMPIKDPYRWINPWKASSIIEALKDMKDRNYLKEEKL